MSRICAGSNLTPNARSVRTDCPSTWDRASDRFLIAFARDTNETTTSAASLELDYAAFFDFHNVYLFS